MVPRAHFGPMPVAALRSVLMSHSFAGCANMARFTFPTPARRPISRSLGSFGGWRTLLVVPLRQQGEIIGTLNARRTEVRPFTPAQIKLLETFADQAVIAIENVRLFNELKESLEQQTATSEILGVIASSPTDIQPVLDAVAENACGCAAQKMRSIRLVEGEICSEPVAHYGTIPIGRRGQDRAVNRQFGGSSRVDRQTIHIHDLAGRAQKESSQMSELLQTDRYSHFAGDAAVAGRYCHRRDWIRRTEVRPFTDKQIALLETFADQAVIAIENVRLFKEIRSATQNYARPWSIRQRRPRCSASSAARRQTCSRSSMPSSKALHGFAGLMTWCCDFRRRRYGPAGSFWSHTHSPPSRSVLMSHKIAGCASMAPTCSRRSRPKRFPNLGARTARTFLAVPLRQQGNSLGR